MRDVVLLCLRSLLERIERALRAERMCRKHDWGLVDGHPACVRRGCGMTLAKLAEQRQAERVADFERLREKARARAEAEVAE